MASEVGGLEGVDAVEVVELVAVVRPSRNPSTRKGMSWVQNLSWLKGDWVLSNEGGGTSRCTSDVGAGPSHTTGHEDTVPAQTISRSANMDYEDPPRMSPIVFSGSAHDGRCLFVPTPGMPTPPLVHVEPTMGPSFRTPNKEVVQIEQILGEDIELVEGLQKSRRPPAHSLDCGTVDGMQFVYTSHHLELIILCIMFI